jgi:hypothetical protein
VSAHVRATHCRPPRQGDNHARYRSGRFHSVSAAVCRDLGTLNIFYWIGALSDAHVFVGETRLVFDNLHTYGWVLLILAAIQLTGGFSLLAGNAYGRVIGIIAASLGALSNLTSIGGNDPWWRLGGFVLCVYILYGLIVFGQDVKEAKQAGQM